MTKYEILKKLLEILTKYLKIDVKFGEIYENDRFLFRGLCNECLDLKGIDKSFYTLQDELLSIEREEKGVVDVNTFDYKNNIALYQGDITRLNADVIVNAGNGEFLGCFIPCHSCIDNVIMSASGFQMRNELLTLKNNKDYENQFVKVTSCYNLPSKFVFHVAGPQILGNVHRSDENKLKKCYTECLNKAKEMKLKNIVFCCISTGVYSFPNDRACKIAVESVKNWLKENKYDIKVVFNVFKDIDKELYSEELRRTNK